MYKKLLSIFLTTISLFSLALCATVPVSAMQFTTGSIVELNNGPHPVTVNDNANGTTINLFSNESLTVSLVSNRSTGFSWQLDQINTAVLQNTGSQYIPPVVLGGNGTEIWTFNPVSPGTSLIVMEYSQPWQGGTKEARMFNLTVHVIAPPSVPASSNLTSGILLTGLAGFIIWFALRKTHQSKI